MTVDQRARMGQLVRILERVERHQHEPITRTTISMLTNINPAQCRRLIQAMAEHNLLILKGKPTKKKTPHQRAMHIYLTPQGKVWLLSAQTILRDRNALLEASGVDW